jgi:hypothetical protein
MITKPGSKIRSIYMTCFNIAYDLLKRTILMCDMYNPVQSIGTLSLKVVLLAEVLPKPTPQQEANLCRS